MTDRPAPRHYLPTYRVTLVREGRVEVPHKRLRTSADVRAILAHYLEGVDREHFVALLLDQKNTFIGLHLVAIGSLTAAVVHPRECLKAAILANAAAMIVGHNHPSGACDPSREDRALTTRLVAAGKLLGIEILDHVIVGDGTEHYYSFADNGCLTEPS